jgi:hypothetical protein
MQQAMPVIGFATDVTLKMNDNFFAGSARDWRNMDMLKVEISGLSLDRAISRKTFFQLRTFVVYSAMNEEFRSTRLP